MAHPAECPLSETDRLEVFRIATKGLVHHYGHLFAFGMSDEELETALTDILGILGGSGGPDRLSVSYKGSGLCIWGGWHTVNHVQEKPLFSGKATMAMARAVYEIPIQMTGSLGCSDHRQPWRWFFFVTISEVFSWLATHVHDAKHRNIPPGYKQQFM